MTNKSKTVNLDLLDTALKSLEEALAIPEPTLIERDGCIQRFEYTFELSWKTLKKYFLFNQNLDESSVKNLFREAGKQNLIDSVEQWFEFLNARNLTSHTYQAEAAAKVYEASKAFAPKCRKLVQTLKELI